MSRISHLGDIHGNFEYLKALIIKNVVRNKKIRYIIQVGDFGIGFNPIRDKETLLLLNKFLKIRNIIMIVIRGNHDNPLYFRGEHMYSNLKLVPDYTTMEIYDYKYLFVGGAISIDRKNRIERIKEAASYGDDLQTYWDDEVFRLDIERISEIKDIDVVITHSAPIHCYPDNRNGFGYLVNEFAKCDDGLIPDLIKERDDISSMFEILKKNGNNIRYHFYGHFHSSNIHIDGYTSHYLVNINEFVDLPCD